MIGVKNGLRITFFSVAFVTLFVGVIVICVWAAQRDSNQGYVKGVCGITGHQIESYETSRKTLYRGYVFVLIPNIVSGQKIEVADNYPTYTSINNYLNWAYSVGSWKNCYYNVNRINDIRFTYTSETDAFIAAMVFFGICGTIIVTWGILEIVWCFV